MTQVTIIGAGSRWAGGRGGPVFELLFGIATHLRRIGKRKQIELVFFNPSVYCFSPGIP
ncbi:hypothetical protein [Acidithiobacillus ferrivorans]|uniref:Uncharacterized protein n=1 Tax=Acidithiobacillus ferrivorans TaxID=160808 RepID=A0A7T4WBB8_9PROT|nr:hypothetical protein [Acidithiobacillus ferrivorans]MBN6741462.1 hypothetical protein [Acidithiobacillus sp. MC6.1]QQD71400.1 hypothetical protein H2515_13800 [Acidithiobacillus ferrivorans]